MKIKRCPFCGGKADIFRDYSYGTEASATYIKCLKCGAKCADQKVKSSAVPDIVVAAADRAYELWNSRAEK